MNRVPPRLALKSIAISALFFGLFGAIVRAGEPGAKMPPYLGKPLVDVLRDFEDRGLVLLFSSAVVSPDRIVPIEPASRDPRRALAEILDAMDLATREGPAESLLIVPKAALNRTGQAQRRPPAHEIQFVTEVMVTPGRHSVMRQEPAAQRDLSRDDLLLSPALGGDVTQAIERLPGVTAADQAAALHVRGTDTTDFAMVLDGLELYDPFHLQGFQSPFSLVADATVDRIDFFGGGFTADRGDRNGGFVDISTTVPAENRAAEIELGSLNSRFLYRSNRPSGKSSWLVSARGWYPQLLTDTAQIGGGDNTEPKFGDAYAKATYQPSSDLLFSFHALLAYDRLEFTEPAPPSAQDESEVAFALTRNAYLWARTLKVWSPDTTSETLLSFGRIDRKRNGISHPQTDAFSVEDRRQVSFFGVKHDATWQLDDSRGIRAGVEVRRLVAEYRYDLIPIDDPAGAENFKLDPHGTSFSVYSSYRARLAGTWITELGLRYDRQTYTGDRQWSPRANAIWRPTDRTEFRFGAGRYYQSQRIHELRIEDGETSFMGAEAADGIEATFRHEFDRGPTLRIDAYYRHLTSIRPRYENLFQPIEWFPETGEDRVRVAPSAARLRGVEFLLSGTQDPHWSWWAGYTLASAEDRIDGRNVPRSWDQPHAGKGLLAYRWDNGWAASLIGSAHTGWPTTPAIGTDSTIEGGEIVFQPILGPRNSDRFSHYFRLDAKIAKRFPLNRGGAVTLTAVLPNLTDRKNVCCVDEFLFVTRPGGEVVAEPQFDGWLGFTPAFSVLWEF